MYSEWRNTYTTNNVTYVYVFIAFKVLEKLYANSFSFYDYIYLRRINESFYILFKNKHSITLVFIHIHGNINPHVLSLFSILLGGYIKFYCIILILTVLFPFLQFFYYNCVNIILPMQILWVMSHTMFDFLGHLTLLFTIDQ